MSKKQSLWKALTTVMAIAIMLTTIPFSAFAASVQEIEEVEEQMVENISVTPSYTSEVNVQMAEEVEEMELETTSVTPRMSSYYTGRWYLGTFTFTDNNRGNAFVINGNKVRVCVAFKKASIDKQSSNIDLEMQLDRITYSGSSEYYHTRWADRFMSSKDTPDADGYYYFVGDWVDVSRESGSAFCLYYEALTELGGSSNGNDRSANVHVWLDIE